MKLALTDRGAGSYSLALFLIWGGISREYE